MTDAQRIFNFFSGFDTDHAGRTVHDYHAMSNDDLEKIHDYIQWAFPTRQPSQCQAANAPLLNDEAVELMKNDTRATGNYYRMYIKIVSFYIDNKHWLVEFDHNHLRITRIIESTAEIFDIETAEQFSRIILNCNARAGSPVNNKSVTFWLRALDAMIARNDDPDEDVELVDRFYVPKIIDRN